MPPRGRLVIRCGRRAAALLAGQEHLVQRVDAFPFEGRQPDPVAPLPGHNLLVGDGIGCHGAAGALGAHLAEVLPHVHQLVRDRWGVELWWRDARLFQHLLQVPAQGLAVLLLGGQLERRLGVLKQLPL